VPHPVAARFFLFWNKWPVVCRASQKDGSLHGRVLPHEGLFPERKRKDAMMAEATHFLCGALDDSSLAFPWKKGVEPWF